MAVMMVRMVPALGAGSLVGGSGRREGVGARGMLIVMFGCEPTSSSHALSSSSRLSSSLSGERFGRLDELGDGFTHVFERL